MCSHFGFVILFPFFYAADAAANNDDSSIWMRAFTDWCLRRNGSEKSFQMNSFIVLLVLFLQSMKINETTWKLREMTSSLLGEISLKKEEKKNAVRKREKRPSLELECIYVVNAHDDCKSEVAKQSIVWIPLEFCAHTQSQTYNEWLSESNP